MTKKQLLERWKQRDFSWSQLSSWEYDPEQWYKRYVLREETHETEEMRFGKMIGEKVASDPKYLPFIKRLNVSEHPFKVMFGKIAMVGYGDFYCSITRRKLQELKTGVKAWNQKRADEHGQIDMYLLMHYITTQIKPEEVDCELIWLPTKRVEGGDFKVKIALVEPVKNHHKIFKTKRTMQDILIFGARINRAYKEMEGYVNGRVSEKEITKAVKALKSQKSGISILAD